MNGADDLLVIGIAGVGEVEAAPGIEAQVVGSAERLAVALSRGLAEHLAVGVEVQDGVLAAIANQVRPVGEDLVAVGGAGLGPDGVFAVGSEPGNDLAMGDVAIADVVEDDALAIVGHFEQLDNLDVLLRGKVAESKHG